ncbi:MAG: helicase C-terminal domain-containing protein [Polyangiales bacterium]
MGQGFSRAQTRRITAIVSERRSLQILESLSEEFADPFDDDPVDSSALELAAAGSPRPSLSERAATALDRGGTIASGLAAAGVAYESRAGQIDMARAVGRAIEDERVLLCDAGTGTGKTLAYLVPALLSGARVVVSTATKALQEQIFTKDLPLLSAHLGVPVKASLMKGLANYVCRRRLGEALSSIDASGERARMLQRIERWVAESESGDRVEASFLRDDDPAFHDVQSGSDTRVGPGCTFYDRCFVTKMRNDALSARLVVVNHHLYLADLSLRRGGAKNGVIPDHDVVVFDEAHQLEEIATEFFGVRASSARVDAIVRDARRTLQAKGIIAKKKPGTASGARQKSPGAEGLRLEATLERAVASSQRFFTTMAGWFAARSGASSFEARAPLGPLAWTDAAIDQLHALDSALEALAARVQLEDSKASERSDEVSAIGARANALRNDLARIAAPTRDDVPWIEVRARSCAIGLSPLDVSSIFRNELFAIDRDDDARDESGTRGRSGPRTIVLTSATLAAAGSFTHAKRRLGLLQSHVKVGNVDPEYDRFESDASDDEVAQGRGPKKPSPSGWAPMELVVPSPFDFQRNAGVYIPLDLPEPNDTQFIDRAAQRIVELVNASQGGAFILCASTRNMRALHGALRDASLSYTLMCQGDAPKSALLDSFRAEGNAVLVATMGFWEGVDVPGSALRLVVIDKLPFAVPTDPVVAARHRAIESEGRSAFAELSIPEAAIALKQGFGRLIRTRADMGVVAILDKRLRTKGYGRSLRASLPKASALHDLVDVQRFFEVVVRPSASAANPQPVNATEKAAARRDDF